MDDLLLARSIDAMNVDGALLRDVKTLRGRAFAKEIIPLVQGLDNGDLRDAIQVTSAKAGKKPAALERVDDRGLLQRCERISHVYRVRFEPVSTQK